MPRRSIGHAHTGQSGTRAGIAAISLAGDSKAAHDRLKREFSPAGG
jgi:hypothetical protein